MSFFSSAAAASPAPAVAEFLSLAPTASQLRGLTAMPSGLYKSSQNRVGRSGGKKSKSRRSERLAVEGQIVSKCFDTYGSRPQPTNGLSLEQKVQMEMTVQLQNFTASTAVIGVPVFAGLVTSISQFSGSTALLSVFDQYRIDQIEMWLEFTAPNGTGPAPTLYSAVDLDDANPPTTVGSVADKAGSIVSTFPAGHYHKWRPHIALATFSGAFTSYANAPAGWIDSASPNVQHYGLKSAIVSNGAAFNVNATIRIVATFRAPGIS